MTQHGTIDIRLAGVLTTYRLGMAEIEELEAELDMSIFLAQAALASELPFLRQKQWRHIIRLGLIGAGVERDAADARTSAMIEEYGPVMGQAVALRILGAALGKVYGDAPSGEQTAKSSQPGSTSPPSTGTRS
ncbi:MULTISPECIES: GTA-gp10 family protein [unclassified Mesorhizobium]|uniref:GTA-gp10 family protein n=1 Tax=unclassified Mesorhizobium TaxID=325217 RepID=UPI0015E4070E|nr:MULTISPECIES: GTA-gp10 family protein [unclassified Mesorhizobium]